MRALPDRPNLQSEIVPITGDPMAISHELSSEIAAALLAAKQRSPHELNDLKEVVYKIHSALEQLTNEERGDRADPAEPQSDAKAKSANL